MATSTEDENKKPEDSKFECSICFETAADAVISMCGHLFCWPCIHRWMETRPNNPVCPVCKSAIDKDRLIPVYGRGPGEQKDPRDTVPPRPQGQREEAANNNQGTGFFGNPMEMGGVNVSFGIGAFPFFGMGPTLAFQNGNGGPRFRRRNRVPGGGGGNQDEQNRQMMGRLMLTFALLFIIMIIIS